MSKTDTFTKTLSKRIPTKKEGVFYKEIEQTTIDEKGRTKRKVIDRVYVIRYRDKDKERLVTMGKYSQGIREAYCKTKRDEFMAMSLHGELPPQVERRRKKQVTTLDELARTYFIENTDKKMNLKQLQKYNLYIGHIIPSDISLSYKESRVNQNAVNGLGSRDIDEITKTDIRDFQKALVVSGKAPKTVNGIIQLLTAIYNHSIKEHDMMIVNPCTGVKRLELDDERERYLTVNEVKRLLEAVKEDEQLYIFTRLALSTGARVNTIMHIQKKNVSLETGSVILNDLKKRKSGSTYTGYLDDELIQALREYMGPLSANTYLIGREQRPKHPRTIQRHLKKILDDLFNQGLDTRDSKNRVVIHTLRHTFASNLVSKGVPIYTVQRLLNHADISQTQRYAKLAPDSGRDAVKGLYNG